MNDHLTADLVGAMFADSRDTTDRLIANLNGMVADADAHRKAVEHGVQELLGRADGFDGTDLWQAVFAPTTQLVAHYRQEPTS